MGHSMDLYAALIDPFIRYGFMQTALLACILLSLSATPIGAFVVLRKLSLVGDTLSHAVLPGAALAFAFFGFSIFAMSIGAVIMALIVAVASGFVARHTRLKEDSSFASFYLISLSLGVCLISAFGNSADMLHFLFGDLLAIPAVYLEWLLACTVLTIALMLWNFDNIVAESFDSNFMRINRLHGHRYYFLFILLFVVNIVMAYFAMGTLLSMGLFVLPVIIARLWVRGLVQLICLSIGIGVASSYAGLLLSFHWNLPSGPCIVLCLGLGYMLSILISIFKQQPKFSRFQT